MPASGVKVADECVDAYEAMKQKRKYKYCIFKLSDNLKHIVLDKAFDNPGCEDKPTTSQDYDPFWSYLQEVQMNRDCRYACFDIRYVTSEGGHRNKLTFIVFCPDEANVKKKMLYASSKDELKNKLIGALEIQASELDELMLSEVVAKALNTTTYR
jgi:cofilin